MASDGVWEFISNEECIGLLQNYYDKTDLEGGCEALMSLALSKWKENSSVIDDITFVLIFLNYDWIIHFIFSQGSARFPGTSS